MKVLIVEDTYETAALLELLLKRNKITSRIAYTGEEALEILSLEHSVYDGFETILLDIGLPDISGIEVCRIIKANPNFKNIPVIFLNAYGSEEFLQSAFEVGAADYILKPFSNFDVLNRLKVQLTNYNLLNQTIEANAQLNSNFEEMLQIMEMLNDQIKERDEQDVLLKESEKKFKLALESANAGTFQYDVKNDVLIWDTRSLEIFGFNSSENTGIIFQHNYQSWRDRLHLEDLEKIESEFQKTIYSTQAYAKVSYRIVKPNGEIGYVLASWAIERDDKNRPEQIFGLHLDFTELFLSEQSIKQSEKNYKLLTENIQEIVWKMDIKGNLLFLNSSYTRILGYFLDRKNLPNISDVFLPDSTEKFFLAIKERLDAWIENKVLSSTFKIDLKAKHINGEIVYLETSGYFILDESNQPIAIQGVMHDVTLRKLNEKKLNEVNENLELLVKQRTLELQQNQMDLQLIFDNAPVIMLVLNRNLKIVQLNKAALDFTQYSAEELIGFPFGNVVLCENCSEDHTSCGLHKACRNCITRNVLQTVLRTQKNQTKVEMLLRVKRKERFENHIVMLTVSVVSVKNDIALLLTIDDITKERKMQHFIKESEEKYRKLYETKQEAVFFIDAQTQHFVEVNQAACQLYGYSVEEFLNLKPQDISTKPQITEFMLEDIVKKREKQKISSCVCKRKNGEEIIVEIQNTFLKLHDKTLICSTHSDITEKQKALEKLTRSEQILRMLVENIDEIFWIYDVEIDKIVYVSPQVQTHFGRSPDFIKENYFNVINNAHPLDKQKLLDTVKKMISGEPAVIEYRTITEFSTVKWLLLKSFGYYNFQKSERYIFGVGVDISRQKITERRVLNAILETENREREHFAKEIHDGIGANLSAIKMSLERILAPDLKPEKKELYFQQVLDLVVHTATTAKDISLNLKPHVLTNLGLISALELLCNTLNELGKLHVKFTYSSPDLELYEEAELAFYRIASELLNNSLKYSSATEAYLNIQFENSKFSLFYSDNGKGFDPDKVMKDKGNGLKNIKARVEALGGEVQFVSKINEGMSAKIQLITDNF
jgi:PAS domain S-box-containing protein